METVREQRGGKTRRSFPAALRRDPLALLSVVFLLAVLLIAIFAPLLTDLDPTDQNLGDMLLAPGTDGHLLGTDDLGRDLYARMLYGARYSLTIGFASVAVGALAGVMLGLIAGYFQGPIDTTITHVVDTMFAFPGMLLAVMFAAYLGAGLTNVIVAVAFWSVPTFARLTRASVLAASGEEYVTAALATGASALQILARHIVPNVWSVILVYATLRVASAIIIGASLSFLGLGVQPPTPEWGALVSAGRSYLTEAPYLVIVPSVAIALTVLTINIFGDWLRDFVDPQVRT